MTDTINVKHHQNDRVGLQHDINGKLEILVETDCSIIRTNNLQFMELPTDRYSHERKTTEQYRKCNNNNKHNQN